MGDPLKNWSSPVHGKIEITSHWGDTRTYDRSKGEPPRSHLGVDIRAEEGTPVYAIGDGKVIIHHWRPGGGKNEKGGNWVIIQHPNGVRSGYMHLSEFSVKNGQKVTGGELIGYSGSTGGGQALNPNAKAMVPHLHFMIEDEPNHKIEPYDYIKDYEGSFDSVDQDPASWQFEPEVVYRSDDPRGSGKLTTGDDAGFFTEHTGGEQSRAPYASDWAGNDDAGFFTEHTGGEQTPAPSGFDAEAGYFTPDTGFEQTPAPSGFGDDIGYFTPDKGFEQSVPPPAWSGQDVGDFTPDTGFGQTQAPSGFGDDIGYFTPDTGFEQSVPPPAWSGQDVGDFTPDTGFEQSIPPPDWST